MRTYASGARPDDQEWNRALEDQIRSHAAVRDAGSATLSVGGQHDEIDGFILDQAFQAGSNITISHHDHAGR